MPSPSSVSKLTDQELFVKILEDDGLTEEEWLDSYGMKSAVPGICTGCHVVTTYCEPDMEKGWCSECDKNTVRSGLILLGII